MQQHDLVNHVMEVQMGVERSAVSAGEQIKEFSSPEAAELAGVTYRQLDHWARRGWVVPSQSPTTGMRRVYNRTDVLRLAALGHLGRSGVNVGAYGRAIGRLRLPDDRNFVVVWAVHDRQVGVTSGDQLRRVAGVPGRYVVFDPTAVLAALDCRRREGAPGTRPRRRTFSPEYKLAVVAEYERLTSPGQKGALLRREGRHASHLLAWRRARSAGELTGSGPSLRSVQGMRTARAGLRPPSETVQPPPWAGSGDVAPEKAS